MAVTGIEPTSVSLDEQMAQPTLDYYAQLEGGTRQDMIDGISALLDLYERKPASRLQIRCCMFHEQSQLESEVMEPKFGMPVEQAARKDEFNRGMYRGIGGMADMLTDPRIMKELLTRLQGKDEHEDA